MLAELDVFTLFPQWFAWLTDQRPVQRALAGGVALGLHSYRDHSPLRHRAVDDPPFGGGAGMVLRVDVVCAALEGAFGKPLDELRAERRLVALDPGGRAFDDGYARELAASPRVALLCARYEGFDARVLEHVATESLSLGPFVLSGGEPVAMAVCDAVLRLQPGALGDERSSEEESYSPALEGSLEYPHYTRPEQFRGWAVPEVLLSGHHARIAAWRAEQARGRRPDAR
jgi:tRNA (guanine37-N1)-methyltransferase